MYPEQSVTHVPGPYPTSPDEQKLYSIRYSVSLGEPIDTKEYNLTSEWGLSDKHFVGTTYSPISQISPKGFMIRSALTVRDTEDNFSLYLIDMRNKKIIKKIINLHGYLNSPVLLENQNKVVFTRDNELWEVGINGENPRNIMGFIETNLE